VPALTTLQLRKSVFRVVGVSVGIEDVDDAEAARGQHQAVGAARSAEPIEIVVDLFSVAAEIDGLAQEGALHAGIGRGGAELVGLGAGKARRAMGIVEAKALIDFGIGPELGPRPQFDASGEREVKSLASKRDS
jgi:hypothetical protein